MGTLVLSPITFIIYSSSVFPVIILLISVVYVNSTVSRVVESSNTVVL